MRIPVFTAVLLLMVDVSWILCVVVCVCVCVCVCECVCCVCECACVVDTCVGVCVCVCVCVCVSVCVVCVSVRVWWTRVWVSVCSWVRVCEHCLHAVLVVCVFFFACAWVLYSHMCACLAVMTGCTSACGYTWTHLCARVCLTFVCISARLWTKNADHRFPQVWQCVSPWLRGACANIQTGEVGNSLWGTRIPGPLYLPPGL